MLIVVGLHAAHLILEVVHILIVKVVIVVVELLGPDKALSHLSAKFVVLSGQYNGLVRD